MPVSKKKHKRGHASLNPFQCKQLYKNQLKIVEQNAAYITSAFALALHRYHGWDEEEILKLVSEYHELWAGEENVYKMCEEETGLIFGPEIGE